MRESAVHVSVGVCLCLRAVLWLRSSSLFLATARLDGLCQLHQVARPPAIQKKLLVSTQKKSVEQNDTGNLTYQHFSQSYKWMGTQLAVPFRFQKLKS